VRLRRAGHTRQRRVCCARNDEIYFRGGGGRRKATSPVVAAAGKQESYIARELLERYGKVVVVNTLSHPLFTLTTTARTPATRTQ